MGPGYLPGTWCVLLKEIAENATIFKCGAKLPRIGEETSVKPGRKQMTRYIKEREWADSRSYQFSYSFAPAA